MAFFRRVLTNLKRKKNMRIFYVINPKTKSPQQLPDGFKKEWLKDFMLDNQLIVVNEQIYNNLKNT